MTWLAFSLAGAFGAANAVKAIAAKTIATLENILKVVGFVLCKDTSELKFCYWLKECWKLDCDALMEERNVDRTRYSCCLIPFVKRAELFSQY